MGKEEETGKPNVVESKWPGKLSETATRNTIRASINTIFVEVSSWELPYKDFYSGLNTNVKLYQIKEFNNLCLQDLSEKPRCCRQALWGHRIIE